MERTSPRPPETLVEVLGRIEKDVLASLGSHELAEYLTHTYDINNLKSSDVGGDDGYSLWSEQLPGIKRQVTTFPGGSWQMKTTFESFHAAGDIGELNIIASKDPSGNITVEGDLPISLIEAYLYETSKGEVDEMRSQLFKILELIKPNSYAIQCKISNSGIILFGFPLTTLS